MSYPQAVGESQRQHQTAEQVSCDGAGRSAFERGKDREQVWREANMRTSVERVHLAMVGCGGLGRRHLRGFHVLQGTDFNNCDLIAVCDIKRQNAEDLADEAQELLGYRPRVWTDLGEMLRNEDRLEAVNVTTEVGSHHHVAVACLEAGKDVQVEKPLALTLRGCNEIIEAARRTSRLLSVAENLRRDPINRLVRSLIEAGAIGAPQLII